MALMDSKHLDGEIKIQLKSVFNKLVVRPLARELLGENVEKVQLTARYDAKTDQVTFKRG